MQASHLWRAAILIVAVSTPALAQSTVPGRVRTVSLSGPRVGVTSLSQDAVDKLAGYNLEVQPLISQFGWQFEKRFYTKDSGLTVLNEWVFLVGGLEQDLVLPSLSWIVGLRTSEGAEIGVGPNITPLGTALVVAAGITFKAGDLNLPVNVAVVPAKSGARISMLAGFNFRKP